MESSKMDVVEEELIRSAAKINCRKQMNSMFDLFDCLDGLAVK